METLLLTPDTEDYENPRASDDKDDQKKKKKLSTAAMKKFQARSAEEVRLQILRQKQEYLKSTKTRVQSEWEKNQAKAEVYGKEFQERQTLLLNSSLKLSEIEETWKNYVTERRKQERWEKYIKCDGLPDPASLSQMNTYIFVWTEVDTNHSMQYCMKKTGEVMKLLKGLEEAMNDSGSDGSRQFLGDLKELRDNVRRSLQEHIDKAIFSLFSRIETDMMTVNVTTSKYHASCPYFRMNLWAELITPIPSSKAEDVRHPLKVTFDDVQVSVTLPVSMLDIHKVMRAIWLTYDHWSDKCRSYDCPPLPSYFFKNMYGLYLMEYDWKVDIMSQRKHLEKVTKGKVAALPQEPTVSQEILAWDQEPQRALSEEIVFRECEEEDNLGRQVKAVLNEFEVNLRERMFLGELLLLEVLHQPPQSQCLRLKHCVTLREEPPKLKPVDFYVKFPSIEQEEDKAQSGRSKGGAKVNYMDEARKKLIIIRLLAPTSVLWFEQPQLANWDPVHEYWSTEHIHEVNFDEEDDHIKFKAGRLGLFGFHVSRYVNFPYEDWLFEPTKTEGEISFHLKTSKTDLKFKIKAGHVCLETMDNAPSRAMHWILGKFYPPSELLTNMKKGGLDLLPGPDASTYVDKVQSKHVVVEKNIYQVWGLFYKSFRFKRSKFNQHVGRGKIVFQAQEIYKDHQVDYCLIETAMCSSFVLDINEESQQYSPEKASYTEECIDLYSLLYQNSTRRARRFTETTCTFLIQTLTEFLGLVRPISFS